jgi:hypothetical protein
MVSVVGARIKAAVAQRHGKLVASASRTKQNLTAAGYLRKMALLDVGIRLLRPWWAPSSLAIWLA